MTSHALLFTLSAIGISETSYLLQKRRAQEKPHCVIGGECHKVLESKYNNILGIPNEVLGLLFYVAISVLTSLLVIGVGPLVLWRALSRIFILSGALFSLVLTYIQWRIIKVWCFWCVMSALTIFLMAVIVLIKI